MAALEEEDKKGSLLSLYFDRWLQDEDMEKAHLSLQ